jgi:hypothetical protein
MKLRPWHWRLLAGGAVAAIVVAAAPDEGQPAEPRLARAGELPQRPATRSPQSLPRIELERLNRPDGEAASAATESNAFSAISWYVPPPPPPPPPPPKPVPPPPPAAPPLMFSYFGRYEADGIRVILLLKGDRIYTVAEGEVIENTYRVERLAGGRLELTYLPLNIKQTLSTGET